MTTPHTDDDTVTAARHALVEQLAHTAADAQTRGLAAAIVDQLHAEIVAGIVLLRTAATGEAGARRYAIEQLEAARDCLDDAAAAFDPSGLPPRPRDGGTLTERLARAQPVTVCANFCGSGSRTPAPRPEDVTCEDCLRVMRNMRSELDPEITTTRTPGWRGCRCGHGWGEHDAGGCHGWQQLAPGSSAHPHVLQRRPEPCVCKLDGVQA